VNKLIIGLSILAMFPAQGAEPAKQQIPIVTAYQDGRAVAATVLPITDSVEACIAALKEFSATWEPKPGVVLLTGCIEAPPVPIAAHKGATTS
jgi:hypothetical protein